MAVPSHSLSSRAELHKLCSHCSTLSGQSKILRNVPKKYRISVISREDLIDRPIEEYEEDDIDGLEDDADGDISETFDHATAADFEASLESGCHLCAKIQGIVTSLDKIYEKSSDRFQKVAQLIPKDGRLRIEISGDKDARECTMRLSVAGGIIPIFAVGDIRLPPPETEHPAQCAISTASADSIDLLKLWIHRCKTLHEQCNEYAAGGGKRPNTRFCPTRLVDVSTEPPRLLITGALQNFSQPYLTLSHCWGKKPMFRLLQGNLEQLQTHIPEEELPINMRDAISITRRLGYCYIWIDTLCIIQDSKQDWLLEAGRMADVYGSSDCTIAAVGPDGRFSCFRERNPLTRRPCRLIDGVYAHGFLSAIDHLREPESENNTTNSLPNTISIYEEEGYLGGLDRMPLLQRGWVVQERLISPRMVYFGLDGLLWQCCSGNASEFHIGNNPRKDRIPEDSIKVKFASTLRPISTDPDVREDLSVAWNSVLQTYTHASLTYASDRYIALAGIASLIQRRTGMSYVSGHWLELMPETLLWNSAGRVGAYRHVNGKISSSMLPLSSLAERNKPTWSWLTATQAINPRDKAVNKKTVDLVAKVYAKCSVLDYVPPTDKTYIPPSLEVHKIQLHLPLMRMYWPIDTKSGLRVIGNQVVGDDHSSDDNFHFTFIPDVEMEEGFQIHFGLIRRLEYKVEQRPARGPNQTFEDEVLEEGLVLVPVGGGAVDSYYRVGLFLHLTLPAYEELSRAFPGDELQLHTITVV